MIMYLHNPRCSKSRQGLEYLKDEKGITPMVVKYLDTPLNFEEIGQILKKLGMKPDELIRKNEDYYKNEIKGKDLSNEELIQAMVDHPKLIERPIIINGSKAVVGRPVENIDTIL
ncbi:arsenate reductase (glutaredoxin) [Plebeiibacterium sediminum]|uniref:Arsenate reductase (Glutaredoxin) n=1 Tax=Plebeiibacterium sediminum TaxID=2992112 RepID=A0AAE3M6E8_9BACT|nr:arsenate reductase (glutaredoxin) [Plebeiobacterium sediminum]MCW3788054.1 arsenate reductase (glutaredoxin) [Plebeiobacterium sediminum]